MSRTYLLLVGGLAVVLAVASFATTAEAVSVHHFSLEVQGIQFVDPSTSPPTPLQDITFTLNGAHAGTMQNPGGPLPASSSLSIVNPGPDGLGDAGAFDVFYTGSPGDFPANSFFDIFTELTDPNTGQPAEMKSGVVKFFNEAKGFGMVVSGHVPGSPEYFYSLTGEINPAQVGLTFADVPVVPGGGSSFFDIFTELQFDGSGTINPNLPLFEITLTTAPEPSTWVLATMGVVALMAVARKRRFNG
jgi:hypothetical protein